MNNQVVAQHEATAVTVMPDQEAAIIETNRIMQTMAVPAELRGRPEEIHSIVNIAANLGIPAATLMGGVHVIHGRVGFSATTLIAIANRSGKLDQPLQYVTDETGSEWCYAVGFINGVEHRGPMVTVQQARAEGWKGKWKNLPGLMLRYRSAAFFIRTVIPEVLMGAQFEDELTDSRSQPIPAADFTEASYHEIEGH